MKKVKFDIQGMTCSSCQSHVERAVKKLEGVQNVNVNLLSNNMTLEYNQEVLDTNKIINAVVDAGYEANIHEEIKSEGRKEEKTNKVEDIAKFMKKRLIISICFLIPLMYLAMHHMFYEWFGLPIPKFMHTFFSGAENRNIIWAYTSFIITANCVCK